jgi:hypothetical protein
VTRRRQTDVPGDARSTVPPSIRDEILRAIDKNARLTRQVQHGRRHKNNFVRHD